MWELGFFSYDFFTRGLFGLKVFFFATSFFIMTLSGILFSWVAFLVGYKKNKNLKWAFWITLALNFIFLALFVNTLLCVSSEYAQAVFFLFTLSFLLCLHFGVTLFKSSKESLGTLIFFAMTAILMIVNMPAVSSGFLGFALQKFGVGGGRNVTLYTKSHQTTSIEGKLILMTPSEVFVNKQDESGITIYDRDKFDRILLDEKDRPKSKIGERKTCSSIVANWIKAN